MSDPEWLHQLPSCDSTNTWAMQRLAGLTHGDVVFTSCQTAGRGQAGRSWQSDPGVLTASVVVHLVDVASGPRLALAAGLALCHAIEDLLGPIGCMIKWPNDVYLQDRKLAGILCEGRFVADRLQAVVGIGCNCRPGWDARPPSAAYTGMMPPISLRSVDAQAPEPRALLPGIRRYLLEAVGMLDTGRSRQLLVALRQRHWLLGRGLRLTSGLSATADEILDDGQLQVLLPDGGACCLDSGLGIAAVYPCGEAYDAV